MIAREDFDEMFQVRRSVCDSWSSVRAGRQESGAIVHLAARARPRHNRLYLRRSDDSEWTWLDRRRRLLLARAARWGLVVHVVRFLHWNGQCPNSPAFQRSLSGA